MKTLILALEWFFLLYFVLINVGYIGLNLLAIPTLRQDARDTYASDMLAQALAERARHA